MLPGTCRNWVKNQWWEWWWEWWGEWWWSGGGSGGGDVVDTRKHYAAVGKSFVVKRSIDLVEGMVGEEKEMMERLLILKKRDDTCVSKLEGIQNELEEIVGRLK